MNALASLLAAPGAAACHIVVRSSALTPGTRALRAAVRRTAPGDTVAYATPLNTPLVSRCLTLLTWRIARRRAMRIFAKGGAEVIAAYGVEPDLRTPVCLFELGTTAATYANRCLRPRTRRETLRRAIAFWCGCDPTLGAILLVGRRH